MDQLLENDFATPAREITSRHRVDRRLLLPLAARSDVRGEECHEPHRTSRPTPYSAEKSKPRSIAVSAILQFAQLRREVRAVPLERTRTWCARRMASSAQGWGSFMIHINSSKAFSRCSAPWANWSFCAPTHLKFTREMTSLFGFEVQCCSGHSSLRHHAARQATITIVYRLHGER